MDSCRTRACWLRFRSESLTLEPVGKRLGEEGFKRNDAPLQLVRLEVGIRRLSALVPFRGGHRPPVQFAIQRVLSRAGLPLNDAAGAVASPLTQGF